MKKPLAPPDQSNIIENSKSAQEVFKLMNDKKVMSFVKKVNENYYSWDKINRLEMPRNSKPKLIWFLIKNARNSNMQFIKLKSYTFQYNVTISNNLQRKLHELDMSCGGSLESNSIVPPSDRKMVLISSLMEEAIASSQLEGAATTRKVAKAMLKAKRKPRNKDEIMILNNYKTIRKIIEMKGKKLSSEMILNIQSIITEETLDKKEWEGKYRDNDEVRVHDKQTLDILHIPPKYEMIPGLIDELCYFANDIDDSVYIHPLIKASILHFLIGFIHPFEDGNGRTARAIYYWFLISKGYWLIEYMAISRQILNAPSKYARAYLYSEHDENDMTYFIHFQIKTTELALENLKKHLGKKQNEKKEVYNFVSISKFNERQSYILLEFVQDPRIYMTIAEVQEKFDIVYQTARSDLLYLQYLGLLKIKKEGRRMLFFKSENFEEVILKIKEEEKKNLN